MQEQPFTKISGVLHKLSSSTNIRGIIGTTRGHGGLILYIIPLACSIGYILENKTSISELWPLLGSAIVRTYKEIKIKKYILFYYILGVS